MSTVLSQPQSAYRVYLDDYKTELMINLRQSWDLARDKIKQVQGHQEHQYDPHTSEVTLKPCDHVMVC